MTGGVQDFPYLIYFWDFPVSLDSPADLLMCFAGFSHWNVLRMRWTRAATTDRGMGRSRVMGWFSMKSWAERVFQKPARGNFKTCQYEQRLVNDEHTVRQCFPLWTVLYSRLRECKRSSVNLCCHLLGSTSVFELRQIPTSRCNLPRPYNPATRLSPPIIWLLIVPLK